jgi:hypothetical protein
MPRIRRSAYARGVREGYRSGLEDTVARTLKSRRVGFTYEKHKIAYVQPEKERSYTPDFVLTRNKIIIETKGRFVTADRQKMVLIKEQHPEFDIRLLFSSGRAKIYKGSKTTHAMWAEKYGFPWAEKDVPQEWIDEPLEDWRKLPGE